jgi:transposase
LSANRPDEDAGTILLADIHYLLPYSPDLNSIEQVFAKLKALLRKIAAGSAFTFRYLFGCRMRGWAHLDGN